MGDFSYLKECIGDLKTKMLSGSYAETLHPIFTMIDSQIFNLERYIENESRKKVEALERVQVLENDLMIAKARVQQLQEKGVIATQEIIKAEEEKREKLEILDDAKEIARQAIHACLDLRHIARVVHAETTKNQMASIEAVWEKTTIKQIVPNRLIISLEETSTINEALQLGSTVSPVYGVDDDVKGIITFFDIIGYIESAISSPDQIESTLLELADPEKREAHPIGAQSVMNIVERFGEVYYPVFQHTPISNLINILNKGIQQIPVCDEDHLIVNIVSHGFLVNVIAMNSKTIQSSVVHNQKTIRQIGLIERTKERIFTVKQKSKVIDALRSNTIGVLNEKNELIGHLTLNDFKNITPEDLPLLFLTVEEFLEKRKVMIPITCTKENTIKQVTMNFIAHKPEHIWIVNKKLQPKGLILITDILNLLDIQWDQIGWD